jgi:hypothetical protein
MGTREEKAWDGINDSEPMLDYMRDKASSRKFRLFAVACCWRILSQLNERWVEVVEAYEKYADRKIKRKDMLALVNSVSRMRIALSVSASAQGCCFWGCSPEWTPIKNATAASVYSADTLAESDPDIGRFHLRSTPTWKRECLWQATLARDIFGNPFRPVTFDRTWRTTTVKQLAQVIYDDKAFDRLPILADALEEAGCSNEIASHFREPGDHVRGCWALDLLLGKE